MRVRVPNFLGIHEGKFRDDEEKNREIKEECSAQARRRKRERESWMYKKDEIGEREILAYYATIWVYIKRAGKNYDAISLAL